MKKTIISLLLLVVFVFVSAVLANSACKGDDPAIKISPKTLKLSGPVSTLTVHSNIPASTVVFDTVALEGIAATSVFADDLGDLVAKIDITELKDSLTPGVLTMTLTGITVDGEAFAVAGTLTVK